MVPKVIFDEIISFLEKQGDAMPEILEAHPVTGGSINLALRLKTSSGVLFLKYNSAAGFPEMFPKEALGLKLLRETEAIDIPEVLMVGQNAGEAFLLLEYVHSASEKKNFWEHFGMQLAKLHSHHSKGFGLDHDNYMGSLVQHNNIHDSWVDFFIEERLDRQIQVARNAGKIGRSEVLAFDRLYKRLEEIFPPTQPSLIHGDLWSGNFMVNSMGQACLIDPAVYYGHPEIDIAMTTLFGGFDARFYEAYNRHNPLEKGWQKRLEIYNLYPLLVHVNLFGGGYLNSVRQIVGSF